MVVERSVFYHIRKQVAIWIYPTIAGTICFLDWNHTRQWKNGEKVSVLDEILGPHRTIGISPSKQQQQKVIIMGTFTWSYAIRKSVTPHRMAWPLVAYLGWCYEQNCVFKREMMKGHSRMFSERVKSMPPNVDDPWKW